MAQSSADKSPAMPAPSSKLDPYEICPSDVSTLAPTSTRVEFSRYWLYRVHELIAVLISAMQSE
jgi:hypothetical protein